MPHTNKSLKIIATANQKGGVGKTTTVVNLSTALAAIDKRVLIIDLDPQGNASTSLGIKADMRSSSTYQILLNDMPVQQGIVKTGIKNLDIIPSERDLAAAEVELSNCPNSQFILQDKLKTITDPHDPLYDFIFIDCPPALGMLTINAMVVADSIIVPMQCEFFSLEGLSHFMKTYEVIKARFNHKLAIEGILLTMFDKRSNLSSQVEQDVRNFFGSNVYNVVIPRNIRISESPSHGKPVIIYDLHCAGAAAYITLAREVIQRNNIMIS